MCKPGIDDVVLGAGKEQVALAIELDLVQRPLVALKKNGPLQRHTQPSATCPRRRVSLRLRATHHVSSQSWSKARNGAKSCGRSSFFAPRLHNTRTSICIHTPNTTAVCEYNAVMANSCPPHAPGQTSTGRQGSHLVPAPSLWHRTNGHGRVSPVDAARPRPAVARVCLCLCSVRCFLTRMYARRPVEFNISGLCIAKWPSFFSPLLLRKRDRAHPCSSATPRLLDWIDTGPWFLLNPPAPRPSLTLQHTLLPAAFSSRFPLFFPLAATGQSGQSTDVRPFFSSTYII